MASIFIHDQQFLSNHPDAMLYKVIQQLRALQQQIATDFIARRSSVNEE